MGLLITENENDASQRTAAGDGDNALNWAGVDVDGNLNVERLDSVLVADAVETIGDVSARALGFADSALITVQEGQQDAFDLVAGLVSSLFKRSADSEERILDAAGQAIQGANRTEDGRLAETAIYAGAAVAAVVIAVMIWKG